MTRTNRPGSQNRGMGGGGNRFTSSTTMRTIVDEAVQATVTERPDGGKTLTTPPEITEMEDGTRIIRAVQPDGAREPKALAEPMIFTLPGTPTTTMAGRLYKVGPGEWKQLPRNSMIRFVNGHARVHTEEQAARIRAAYKDRVYQEPAPLLSEEDALARGLEPPYLVKNKDGKVVFWSYHRKAMEQFQQMYHAQHGI